MSTVKKLACGCPNDFQDMMYGSRIRVFNKTAKDGDYRCTSCGHAVPTIFESKTKTKGGKK